MGFAIESPNTLVMWEAQFGDFCNGAQIIIDQFLAAGEQKWFVECGLVLLLPHGQEGMGPEHSSGRMERFLINSDCDPAECKNMNEAQALRKVNWQIVNCTTPANYFHVLRRQMHRNFRKPLIVFTPKSLLRSPVVRSNRDEFDDRGDDIRFISVYGEKDEVIRSNPQKVNKVIFCTGKIYYDIFQYRQEHDLHNVAIIRLEQLSPFPYHEVKAEIEKYSSSADVVWCQEEAKNQGAWQYVYFFFESILHDMGDVREIGYNGRYYSASPATGSIYRFKKEQEILVQNAYE